MKPYLSIKSVEIPVRVAREIAAGIGVAITDDVGRELLLYPDVVCVALPDNSCGWHAVGKKCQELRQKLAAHSNDLC